MRNFPELLKRKKSNLSKLPLNVQLRIGQWVDGKCSEFVRERWQKEHEPTLSDVVCRSRMHVLEALTYHNLIWFGYSPEQAKSYFKGGSSQQPCLIAKPRNGYAVALLDIPDGQIRIIGLSKDQKYVDKRLMASEIIPSEDCAANCDARIVEKLVRIMHREYGVVLVQHECMNAEAWYNQLVRGELLEEYTPIKTKVPDHVKMYDLAKEVDEAFETSMKREGMATTKDLRDMRDEISGAYQILIDNYQREHTGDASVVVISNYGMNPYSITFKLKDTNYLILGDGFLIDALKRELVRHKITHKLVPIKGPVGLYVTISAAHNRKLKDYEAVSEKGWESFYGLHQSLPFVKNA